jgi:AcrR family transcriptional regulator
METEKELRVLEAAKTVFLRYGFRRVTMQDVAEEAGISRPALYLIYPNKEEIFKAAVRGISAQSFAEIREGLKSLPSVEARLLFAFEVWTVRTFELMLASPDAKDLVNCVHEFARETILQAYSQFEAILAEILTPLTTSVPSPVLSAEQIAHLLAASIHGYKETATTVAEIREMISGLIALTLAALKDPALAKA